MRNVLGSLILAAMLSGFAGCGISEDDARTILADAERAGRETSYRGIVVRRFTLEDEERTTTVRIHHGLSGTRYEADRPGGREAWSHFSTDAPEIHWMRDRDLLLASYRFTEQGTETVAGRETVRYLLKARLPDRPSRRFWVDRETGLMLRDEGLDADGQVYETMHFEMIEYGGDDPVPDLEPSNPTNATARETALETVDCDALSDAVGFEPHRPRSLPEGFRLLRCHVKDGARKGTVLVYGDGLAQFVISEHAVVAFDGGADAADPDEETEVRRQTLRGGIRLGLRHDGTEIDISSRTVG